jgi:hypothetical protein
MMFLTERADANKDHGVRRALASLAMMAERQRLAVLVCAHLNKDEQKQMLYRVGGSIGIVGLARSVLFLAHDPDDPDGDEGDLRLLAHAASNWAKRAPTLRYRIEVVSWVEDGERITTTKLVADGESELSAEELIAPARRKEPKKTDLAEHAICKELQDGPRLSSEVKAAAMAAAGCALMTVERAAMQLRLAQVIGRTGNTSATQWFLLSDSHHPPPEHDDERSESPLRARARTEGDSNFFQHHAQGVLAGIDEGSQNGPVEDNDRARVEEELRRRERPR